MRSSQTEALSVVVLERSYQEAKWAEGADPDHDRHSPTDWLVYIEDYLNEAKHVGTRREEPYASTFILHTMRKIAAMAVCCMEQHGALSRSYEGARPVGFTEP